MPRAIEPRALPARHGVLRYAIAATAVAGGTILAWSIWAGATVGNGAEAPSLSAWVFGVVALLVTAACAAVAGHFHARARQAEFESANATAPAPPSPDSTLPAPPGLWDAELELLLRALPGPAWLMTREHDDRPPVVSRHNEAARTLLRDAGSPPARDWNALLHALPPAVADAVRTMAPGASLQRDGWQLRLDELCSPLGLSATLLSLQALPPVEPTEALQRAVEGTADHESFTYTVSHDLRAPIRVVEGFTRILKEDYGRLLDRIGNDHLDRVLGAAARMNSMIDALLALSQLSTQPLARQPVNLSQLAGFIVDDLRRECPAREAEVHIEPGLMADGDPTLLRMVLENLLGNAWKYSGKCTVAKIGFETVSHHGREVFVVRDNGAGFDMRFADRLFGVFQRLHSANDFQGTGVGLASVRRIVRRHGGDVWAESDVGQGARFYFTLGPR